MSELKMFPQEAEALNIIESMLDVADMRNKGPIYADDPPRSGLCRIPEEDAAILRQYIADRRAQPANEPLMLAQLRNMGNMAVWAESDDADDPRCGAYIVDDRPEFCSKPLVNCHHAISADEIKSGAYRIYRRKPEATNGE